MTWTRTWLFAVSILVGGCATGPYADPKDPLEPLNREIYAFNDAVDQSVAQPVAKAYQQTIPSVVRTGIGNFFSNLGDAWSGVNALMQGKGEAGMTNIMRFTTNTVFGLGGVLDIASEMRMRRTRTDLSDTLGVWGIPSGPYVVIPLLGPSTARGVLGKIGESHAGPVASPLSEVNGDKTRVGATVLQAVDQRARLLSVTDQLSGLALDPYSFVRDAYLQREAQRVSPHE
jgi:phospholipid-binding lipoprotein MlaA